MTQLNTAIRFNSSTGSDTAASGVGPATAVTGNGASTTASSAVVTGISTTGVTAGDLLWVQSSSGRQFSVIASVDSSTQVTCDDTFTNTESGRGWAIGGKRATLAGSSVLYDQSGSNGDAKAGHILELDSGYTETLNSTINLRVPNSGSQGLIVRGALDAETKPILTFTHAGTGFLALGSYQLIQNLELKNSSATKTNCRAVSISNYVNRTHLDLLDIHDQTDFWQHGFYALVSGNTGATISRCSIGNCSGNGVLTHVCNNDVYVYRCKLFNCTGGGFRNAYSNRIFITNNLFYGNGSYGAFVDAGTGSITGNIFHNNGTDSIKSDTTSSLHFAGNIVSSTTNGINVVPSLAYQNSNIFDLNAFYNCTNNTVNIEATTGSITLTADPFVSASTGDFNLNADAGGGAVLRSNNYTVGG